MKNVDFEELKKKVNDFGDLLDSIETLKDKKKLLWKESSK